MAPVQGWHVNSWSAPYLLKNCIPKEPQNGRKYLQIRYPITDHATVKDSPTERWAMDLNRYFSREDMKMTNKHMKRCPTSLALCAVLSCSVVSSSLRPHGLQPCRLLCPWDSPGKNTGVSFHALLQGSNLHLLLCRQILYPLSHLGSSYCRKE